MAGRRGARGPGYDIYYNDGRIISRRAAGDAQFSDVRVGCEHKTH